MEIRTPTPAQTTEAYNCETNIDYLTRLRCPFTKKQSIPSAVLCSYKYESEAHMDRLIIDLKREEPGNPKTRNQRKVLGLQRVMG